MPAAARLGDQETGTCNPGLPDCPHTRNGTSGTVSGDVYINGLGAHRKSAQGHATAHTAGHLKQPAGAGPYL